MDSLVSVASIKLTALPIGARGLVKELNSTASVRLREMGLLVGTTVTLVRLAPMGDPLEIKVRGYHLTLRKSEAETIFVEPLA